MPDQRQLRVVSLLPSATDLVSISGGLHLLVGRSHECDWPVEVQKLPILTGAINQFQSSKQMDDVVNSSLARGEGLYFLEQQRLQELKPDVIVTQDLCNVCSVDLKLVEKTIADFPVKPKIVTLNPQKLSDVLSDLTRVGQAIGMEQQSKEAVQALQNRVKHAQAVAQAALAGQKPIKVAFIEWLEPLFMGGHWTPEMIRMAGGVHPLNMPIGDGGAGPSFRTSHEALVEADCDWNVVCPCGFSIKDTLKEADLLTDKSWWQELRAVKAGKVVIVDGSQMFARPGPRLVDALEFLVGLLHNKPELIPKDFPWQYWPTSTSTDSSLSSSTATDVLTDRAVLSDADTDTATDKALVSSTASDEPTDGHVSSTTALDAPEGESVNSGRNRQAGSSGNAGATNSDGGIAAEFAQLGSSSNGISSSRLNSATTHQHKVAGSDERTRGVTGVSAKKAETHKPQQERDADVKELAPQTLPNGTEEQQASPPLPKHHQAEQAGAAASQQHDAANAAPRRWCFPDLGPDIEEAHATAVRDGKPTYTDPATGYMVLTEQTLRQQSVCCANRCRHCPFGHFKVPAAKGPRVNIITEPTLLRLNRKSAKSADCQLVPWPAAAVEQNPSLMTEDRATHEQSSDAQQSSRDIMLTLGSSSSTSRPLTVPSEDSIAESGCVDGSGQNLVFLVVVDFVSMLVWGSRRQSLHDVLDWALRHKQPLFVLPVDGHAVVYTSTAVDEHKGQAYAALLNQT